jgi:hypothetical protein
MGRRTTLAIAAVVAAALGVGACGSDSEPQLTVAVAPPETAQKSPTTATQPSNDGKQPADTRADRGVAAARSSQPPADRPTLAVDAPSGAYPAIWVRTGRSVEVRTDPGGGQLVERVHRRTAFGSPSVFGVIRVTNDGRWAGVTTPALANNRLGWIRLDPSRLRAGWTKVAIAVDLSERRAELVVDGKVKRAFSVSVGAPGVDTPTGRFAVTDTFRGDLNPAYGCCAVALSATQPHLPSGWLGGNRVAIHGTDGPLGEAISHGCIRAPDPEVSKLVDRVPLGAPVFIRA